MLCLSVSLRVNEKVFFALLRATIWSCQVQKALSVLCYGLEG